MSALSAEQELELDHGWTLNCCSRCGTCHWSDGECPECGAGAFWQCHNTPQNLPCATHQNYAQAYRAAANRTQALLAQQLERAELHERAAKATQ